MVRRYFSRDLKRARDETDDDQGRLRSERRRRQRELTESHLSLFFDRGRSSRSLSAQASWRESDGPSGIPKYSLLSALSDALAPPRKLKYSSFEPKHPSRFNQLSSIFNPTSASASQDSNTESSQLPLLSTSQASDGDEEVIKTPIVTPNGSLIFQDADVDDTSTLVGNDILDTSSLPESQVGRFHDTSNSIPDGGGGLTASQMGVPDSQPESQPAWQPQSHSSPKPPSRALPTEAKGLSKHRLTSEVLPTNAVSSKIENTSRPSSPTIPSNSDSRRLTLAALLSPKGRSGRLSRNAGSNGLPFEREALPGTSGRYRLRGRRASSPMVAPSHTPTRSSPLSAGEIWSTSSAAYCAKLRSRTPQKPMPREASHLAKKRSASKDVGESQGKGKRPRVSNTNDESFASSTLLSDSRSKPSLRRSPRRKR